MRIIALENAPSSREGGQELSFFDVLKGLHGRGHQITLLYVRDGDLLEVYQKFCERTVRVRGYRALAARPLASLGQIGRDILRVPVPGPAVVYANQYLDAFFAAGLSLYRRCPFVCHLRLPAPDRLSRQYRFGLRRAKRLIAVSEHTRSTYAEQGLDPSLIRVVHNGIDTARFVISADPAALRRGLGLPDKGHLITYAGRLHPAKGVETLIEAFARICRASEGDRLVIAGDVSDILLLKGVRRDHRAELEAYAAQKGISDAVVWMKHCSRVPELLAASDAVVLPSLWPEPFGRTLIESMACGVPAVGSRVGGIPEVLTGEFGRFLFGPGMAGQLAALLESLRGWRHNEPSLSARCRAHIEKNFTIERTVEGVEAVFREVVG